MADLYERRLKYLEKARQAYKTKLESIDPHVRVMRRVRKEFHYFTKNKNGCFNRKILSVLLRKINRVYDMPIPDIGESGRLNRELFYDTYGDELYHEMFHIERAYAIGLENGYWI